MSCLLPEVPGLPTAPSFEAVYNTGLPFVRQVLRWLGVAEYDLDDVLQDVMIAAYRALPRFDPRCQVPRDEPAQPGAATAGAGAPSRAAPLEPPDALRRWLFGIAWRQASHYRGRAHRRREIAVGAGPSWPLLAIDPGPSSEQVVAREQRSRLIAQLLERIELDRRVVLVMYELLEIPISEIARELELKETTVRNRLRLARQDFRLAVKRLSADERRALSPGGLLTASESRRGFEPDALLRSARSIPEVPEELRVRVWIGLQRAIVGERALLRAAPIDVACAMPA